MPALPPWFASPPPVVAGERHVSIIGAGLAGCCLGREFSRRGWRITLIDARGQTADPEQPGIIQPYLDLNDSPARRWYDAGLRYTLDLLTRVQISSWRQCGVFRAAADEPARARFKKIAASGTNEDAVYINHESARKLCGVEIRRAGLFFARGGFIDFSDLCRALRAGCSHECVAATAAQLAYDPAERLWSVYGANARLLSRSPLVVIAAGSKSIAFSQSRALALAPVRGQSTLIDTGRQSAALKTIISAGASITPACNNRHRLGATFDRVDLNPQPRPQDDAVNLRKLRQIAPSLYAELAGNKTSGRVGFRAVSPDHLPLLGPLPIADRFCRAYADLHHGRAYADYPPAPVHSGLYVCTGFGARGLISAPLAAHYLAGHIGGETPAITDDVACALHPARFLVRALKKKRSSSR